MRVGLLAMILYLSLFQVQAQSLGVVELPAPGQPPAKLFLSSPSSNLSTCDKLHHIATCDIYHFTEAPKPGPKQDQSVIGSSVQLNGFSYRIDWAGDGYHLDSGVIVAPTDSGSWEQVYPVRKSVSVDNWIDESRDSFLSPTDLVEVDGQRAVVTEALFYLWVVRIE